jgi:hypothetical protein
MQGDANVFLSVKVGDPTKTMDIGRAIARIDVHDEDRGTDKATLVMDDHVGISTDVIQRNAPVTVELGWESEHAVIFMGRVHKIGSYTKRGAIGQLQFEVRDLSELMNVRPKLDNRQHSGTLKEILTQLASEAGLKVGAVAIDPMPKWPDTHKRLLNQGTRTNWQLIQDVARDYGSRAFVEVNTPAKTGAKPAEPEAKLYFFSESAMLAEKPLGKLTLCHGWGSLIKFDMTRIGTGSAPPQSATVVDPVTGKVCTETAEGGGEQPAPAISGGALDQLSATRGPAAARSAESGLEVTAKTEPRADAEIPARKVGTPSDCDMARRDIQPDETRRLGLSASGEAMGTVFMRAKSSVEIEGHSSQATGRWYLKRVNHIVEQARAPGAEPADVLTVKTYRTRFEATR